MFAVPAFINLNVAAPAFLPSVRSVDFNTFSSLTTYLASTSVVTSYPNLSRYFGATVISLSPSGSSTNVFFTFVMFASSAVTISSVLPNLIALFTPSFLTTFTVNLSGPATTVVFSSFVFTFVNVMSMDFPSLIASSAPKETYAFFVPSFVTFAVNGYSVPLIVAAALISLLSPTAA